MKPPIFGVKIPKKKWSCHHLDDVSLFHHAGVTRREGWTGSIQAGRWIGRCPTDNFFRHINPIWSKAPEDPWLPGIFTYMKTQKKSTKLRQIYRSHGSCGIWRLYLMIQGLLLSKIANPVTSANKISSKFFMFGLSTFLAQSPIPEKRTTSWCVDTIGSWKRSVWLDNFCMGTPASQAPVLPADACPRYRTYHSGFCSRC